MPAPTNAAPALIGPHCSHEDCSWHTCDHTGYAEHPCRHDGCEVCGAPSTLTVEHWGGDSRRWQIMTLDEQARVLEYWSRYPLVRRAVDTAPVITAERLEAAGAVTRG